MHIESTSLGERRTRMLLMLLMCAGFSAWFAYDGIKGYPKTNLEIAMKEMPKERPSNLKTNPQVTSANLSIIQERLAKKEAVTRKDLTQVLGDPAWEQDEEHTYIGSQWTAVTRLAGDKVVFVTSAPADSHQPTPENTNYLVRPDRLGKVQAGMSREELRDILGKPSKIKEKTLWYTGPAAFAAFPMTEKVVGEPLIRKLEDKSESDIFMQKVLAAMLAVGSLFLAFKFIRVLKLRILLDNDGLHVNNKHIPWDSMIQLKTDDYLRKGWVDLVYKNNERVKEFRLDSFHISRFKEMVQAICERKGFPSPLVSAQSETPADRS